MTTAVVIVFARARTLSSAPSPLGRNCRAPRVRATSARAVRTRSVTAPASDTTSLRAMPSRSPIREWQWAVTRLVVRTHPVLPYATRTRLEGPDLADPYKGQLMMTATDRLRDEIGLARDTSSSFDGPDLAPIRRAVDRSAEVCDEPTRDPSVTRHRFEPRRRAAQRAVPSRFSRDERSFCDTRCI